MRSYSHCQLVRVVSCQFRVQHVGQLGKGEGRIRHRAVWRIYASQEVCDFDGIDNSMQFLENRYFAMIMTMAF